MKVTKDRLDAIAAELAAAKEERLDVLSDCELFAMRLALAGDEEASVLVKRALASRRRNQLAILEAQLVL